MGFKRILSRGSENGVSRRYLEHPLGEYDALGMRWPCRFSLYKFWGSLGSFSHRMENPLAASKEGSSNLDFVQQKEQTSIKVRVCPQPIFRVVPGA